MFRWVSGLGASCDGVVVMLAREEQSCRSQSKTNKKKKPLVDYDCGPRSLDGKQGELYLQL
jgi:hypothetical protein